MRIFPYQAPILESTSHNDVSKQTPRLLHELLMQWKNRVIKPGGEKEWGQNRAVPINPENSSTGQSQAVPTNPEHEADSDLSSERF
ncbi:hypothetical protein J6590_051488 [Homalodisca vitripennis]|nr:hypothetical protein J6590_051488 [Homalodisca vitripennis]